MADRSTRTSTRASRSSNARTSPSGAVVFSQQSYSGPAGEPSRPRQPQFPIQAYSGPAGLPAHPQHSYGGPAVYAVRPAGAVPPASYGAGSITFATTMQAVGAEPFINTAGFLAVLQRTVAQIMGAGVRVSGAQIVKGARTTQSVPRTGFLANLTGASLTNRDVSAWWVNINNLVVTATSPYELNGTRGLNRAIARAVAEVTAWRNVESGYTAPTDGGSLDAQFRTGAACDGGANYAQVWAKACTRPVDGSAAAIPTPINVATPIQPAAPNQQVSLGQVLATGQTCAVRLQAASHLRTTATFALGNSPSYPAGTAVTVTGPHVAQQGSLTLYPVSIAGREGFMPLSPSEMAPCTLFTAPAPLSSGGGSSSRPVGVQTYPSAPRPANLAALSGESNAGTYAWIAAAVIAAFAITAAVVKRKEIKAALSTSTKSSSTATVSRRGRTRYSSRNFRI